MLAFCEKRCAAAFLQPPRHGKNVYTVVQRRKFKRLQTIVLVVCGGLLLFAFPREEWIEPTFVSVKPLIDYEVPEECKKLPFIRPLGTYFLDNKVAAANSPEGVTPSFRVGSIFGEQAMYHMGDDVPNFDLIKELLENRNGTLALDIGANQGFYSWYLASLGLNVHSFEIFQPNVKALQHGAEFNPPEVAKRVHIYPVGLGNSVGRMGMKGNNYEGRLQGKDNGPILSSTFDCFAYHNLEHIGNDLISDVGFVKLDVEGFEIAVLLGAKKSLFGPHGNIGGMLVEVGPSRWSRAGVLFDQGLSEMKELSTHFKNSFVILRTQGPHAKTCPVNLAEKLADKNPRAMPRSMKMFKVKPDEWISLLKELDYIKGDCNFWYTN